MKRLFFLLLLFRGLQAQGLWHSLEFNSSESFDGYYFRLLEFSRLPTDTERKTWEKQGFVLTDYYPDKKYIAAIKTDFALKELPEHLLSVARIPLKMRVNPLLLEKKFPYYSVEGNLLKIIVVYYKVLSEKHVAEALQNFGFELAESYPAGYALEGTIPIVRLSELLSLPFLQYVDFVSPPEIPEHDYEYGGITRANWVQNINSSYNAEGIRIMVSEGRVDSSLELSGRLIVLNTSGSVSSHATGVAWHMSGAPIPNPSVRNNAWGATVYSENSISAYDDYYDTYQILYTNHSLGYGIDGGYDWYARMLDNLSLTYPYIAVCYSAGNSGSSTGFAPYDGFSGWANITGKRKQNKNHFETGATDRWGVLTDFSSRGPTYDGRVYPVVVTEGSAGTSFASPKTTGSLAILQKIWLDYHPNDSAEAVKLRTILTASADDDIENPGIDFKTGYGMINLRRAYRIIDNNWLFTDSISTGQTHTFNLNITGVLNQLRVMLMWPDVPAAINAPKALVNNLDLFLVSPANDTIYPWVLNPYPHPDSLNAPATRQKDTLNNAELVTVNAPITGTWQVVVKGTSIPMGPQKYYIAYEKRPEELVLTFPTDSISLLKDAEIFFYWDYYSSTSGNFTLKYQIDGGAWQTVSAAIPAEDRAFDWTIPGVGLGIHEIRFAIINGSLSDTSGICFITDKAIYPEDACDLGKIMWDSLPGISDYEVYYLDSVRMEPVSSGITINSTGAVITSLDLTQKQLLAVVPKQGNRKGFWYSSLIKNAGIKNLPEFQGFEYDAVGTTGATFISGNWQLKPSTGGYEWEVNLGGTPSTSSGPMGAFEGSNYIYTEGSIGTLPQQTATLVSPCLTANAPEISFYYHMYVTNSHIDGLFIDFFNINTFTWVPLDSILTAQQNSSSDAWLKKTVSLGNNTGTFKVRFRALRAAGNSYFSDYALDSIYIRETNLNADVALIVDPLYGVCEKKPLPVVCAIINKSSTPIPAGTGIPVDFHINSSFICSETFFLTADLSPNDMTFFTPSSCLLSFPNSGIQTLTGIVKLNGDPNSANDTSTITASVLANTFATLSPTACQSYISPSGNVYNMSGTYTDTIPNAAGCDSIITINLTVISIDTSVTQIKDTLIASQAGASYQWIDCSDSSVIQGANQQIFVPANTGNYAVAISLSGCTDTSFCHSVVITRINAFSDSEFNVFPNPTASYLNIQSPKLSDYTVRLLSLQGKELFVKKVAASKNYSLDMTPYPAGVYILEISREDTKQIFKIRVE